MKLIVGLGNPGTEYEMTRHNAGFLALDYLLEQWTDQGRISDVKKVKAKEYQVCETQYQFDDGHKENIALLKPLTFMNASGNAVKVYRSYHSDITISDDVWILHDELDVVFGRIKVDHNRSSAGHNGIQNIIDVLGTKDFNRIRIGVGASQMGRMTAEQYVLKNFSATEKKALPDVFNTLKVAMEHGLQFGCASAQNYANSK